MIALIAIISMKRSDFLRLALAASTTKTTQGIAESLRGTARDGLGEG
jgi:hypothetical protein